MKRATAALGFTLSLAMLGAPAAHAQTADILDLVRSAARSGHAIESLLGSQPAIAVPLATRPCATVGVIYQASGAREKGGPRIDNFRACAEAEPAPIDEVSPALPEDAAFKQQTRMAMRTALRYGRQQLDWQGYRVEARRLSQADTHGCAQLETIVSAQDLLVAYGIGRMCP